MFKISYNENWQKNHWFSIQAAYNNAPFFEHYASFFQQFYTKKYDFLFDYNLAILNTILQILSIESKLQFSSIYENELTNQVQDFRNRINTSKINNHPMTLILKP